MKLKALVATAILATVGVAHASIATRTGAGDASEVFATIFNGNASITIDLGLNQDVLATSLSSPLSYNLSADVNWSAFMTAAGSAPLLWSVQSVDTDVVNGWTTARIGQESNVAITNSGARINSALESNFAALSLFADAVNLSTSPVSQNKSDIGVPGSAKYWTLDGSTQVFGFGLQSNVVNSGAVSIFQFQDNVADPFNAGADYDWSKSPNTVRLSNTTGAYTLSFQAVAAVPEPESYALALAALGAIGFVARRRKA